MTYDIIPDVTQIYRAIVLPLTSDSLTDSFSLIEKDLLNNKYVGKILLDYYLYNNDKNNRYFEMTFDGERFIYSSFKAITVSRKVSDYISLFYKKHSICFNN